MFKAVLFFACVAAAAALKCHVCVDYSGVADIDSVLGTYSKYWDHISSACVCVEYSDFSVFTKPSYPFL